MRHTHLIIVATLIGNSACASKQPTTESAGPTRPAEDIKPSQSQARLSVADMDALIRMQPAADAAKELRQFGQFEGSWLCLGSRRQPDGSWKTQEHESRWTWFYTLGGYAVQDVFITPTELGGGVGTNIRIYEPKTNSWSMVWTTTGVKAFNSYVAQVKGDTIEMRGEISATNAIPAHQARITFHNIKPMAFSWKYEGGKIGGDQFREFSRLACRRDGAPADIATAAEKAA